VLLLVDGFGWRFSQQFQDEPFLATLARDGRLERLTSQFPSTTSAHLTTLHSGQTVGQSGLYEWYLYEPLLDAIYAPLLFSPSGTMERELLAVQGVDPRPLYPRPSFYRRLKAAGVRSYLFQPRAYTPSTYSRMLSRGAALRPYASFPAALVEAGRLIREAQTPSYLFLYYEAIDATSHAYGPSSEQVEAEILSFLAGMGALFSRTLAASGKRVCFLLTADHGQVEVEPQATIYLNTDRRFKGVERFIAANQRGELLVPAGSARDLFLHLRPERLEEARAFLSTRLQGLAEVVPTAELIAGGWFGPQVSRRFRQRVGNLVVLPHAGQTVWWYEKERFEMNFHGHHGGLSPQEMYIPLFTRELG
jgi:predicted AlkP superfamily pyrophosphatase or phosphodiesterase